MYSKSKKSIRKGTNKTARQKQFHARVASLGCMITGDKHHVTLHHIKGAKAELKTIDNGSVHIGEDCVIPLHPIVHLYQYAAIAKNNDLLNLEAHKQEFIDNHGTELDLFGKMRDQYNERWPDCEFIDNKKIDLIIENG